MSVVAAHILHVELPKHRVGVVDRSVYITLVGRMMKSGYRRCERGAQAVEPAH